MLSRTFCKTILSLSLLLSLLSVPSICCADYIITTEELQQLNSNLDKLSKLNEQSQTQLNQQQQKLEQSEQRLLQQENQLKLLTATSKTQEALLQTANESLDKLNNDLSAANKKAVVYKRQRNLYIGLLIGTLTMIATAQ